MELLWEEPEREFTGRDVANALPDYAYTTVATILDRLVTKEMVSRRKEGRTIRFSTIATRADHTAELMHEALVLTGDRDSTLIRFAQTLSRSEADVLRRTLEQSTGKVRRTTR